jgi:hypothetical protein
VSQTLTAACSLFTIQVSDRLITEENLLTKERREFDVLANKAVLYRARDGLISLGYVGAAFLERMPADEWLAEKLQGQSLAIPPPGATPKLYGPKPASRDIGLAVRSLKEQIELLTPTPYGLTISIAGWQTDGKRVRPILICLIRGANEKNIALLQPARSWSLTKLAVGEIGGYLSKSQKQALAEALEALPQSQSLPQDFERVMAETIRETSVKNRTVGPNLMSIVIPRLGLEKPHIRFLPSSPHHLKVDGEDTIEAAFTPFIVDCAGTVLRPSVVVGGFTMHLGGLSVKGIMSEPIEIVVEGPQPTGHIKFMLSSQRRRPDPSKR